MKKALLFAPMASVHRRFNKPNIDALRNNGFEVHLLANFENGEGPEKHNSQYRVDSINDGLIVHSMPFSRSSLIKNISLISKIRQLLHTEQFDIVHTHTETGGILMRLTFANNHKTKFCYTPHGMSFYKGSSFFSHLVYKPIEKLICSSMDANLAMNLEELEYLNKWDDSTARFVHGIGLDINRIKSVDINCRTEIRKEFDIPKEALLLLSIGELNDNKNHIVAIEALSKIEPNKRPYYLICGVGDLKLKLNESIKRLGLDDRVILAGYRSDIPQIIAASDIFIFPSFHEGLPVSVLEAMAGGLPAIISKIRGNVDLIKDGENGYLFSPTDANELYQKLCLVLNSASKRSAMGLLNSKLANNYSFDVVKAELQDIYLSL